MKEKKNFCFRILDILVKDSTLSSPVDSLMSFPRINLVLSIHLSICCLFIFDTFLSFSLQVSKQHNENRTLCKRIITITIT